MTLLLVAAAAVAILTVKVGARRGDVLAAGADDPAAEYARGCAGTDSVDCAILRGRVRAAVLIALDELAVARDVRPADAALAALELDDPAIQTAALRVLDALPPQPGAEKALPLLLSDRPVLRRAAALVLADAAGDAGRIARYLQQRSASLASPDRAATALEGEPPPPDVAKLGFPTYAGWTRYPPADSAGAVGFSTADPVATVAAFYQQKLGVAPMDREALGAFEQSYLQEGMRGAPTVGDPDMKEIEKLVNEYTRTQDPAVLERLEAAQQRLQQRFEGIQQEIEPGALEIRPPGDGSPARTLRAFVAEKRGRRPVRLVYVYREDAFARTVVELVWDPKTITAARGGR